MTETQADVAWMLEAACRGMDTRLYFPYRGEVFRQAEDACKTCPVKTECLHYAIDNHIKEGTWGGMTQRQRRTYARKMRREALDVQTHVTPH